MVLGGRQEWLRLAPLSVWLHVCHQEQTEPFWGFSSKEKCQNWHNVCSNKLCWQHSCGCHPNVNEPRWLREAISRRKRHRTYLHLAGDYKYHCSLSSSQTETAGSVSAVQRCICPSCFITRLTPRGWSVDPWACQVAFAHILCWRNPDSQYWEYFVQHSTNM